MSLEVITLAEENGSHILTFPPHCSHKLQPLDVGIFRPFERSYNRACDAWMTSFPDQPLTIYYIAELAGRAFSKAFCQENIVSSFKKTGIYRLNPDIFTKDMFLSAAVTDHAVSMLAEQPTSSTSDDDGRQDISILTTIVPFPKAIFKPVRRKTRQQKFSVITDTANKLKCFPHLAKSSSKSKEIILESDEPVLSMKRKSG